MSTSSIIVLACRRVSHRGKTSVSRRRALGKLLVCTHRKKIRLACIEWVKKLSKLTEGICGVKSELNNHRWFTGLLQSKLRRKKLEQWEIKLCWGEFRQKFDNLTKCHVSLCYSSVICLFWLSCPLCESTVTEAETYTLSFGHWFVKYLFNRRQFFPIDVKNISKLLKSCLL